MRGKKRPPSWWFDDRSSRRDPLVADRADRDYLVGKVRPRYSAPLEERVAYVRRWREIIETEAKRAAHAYDAREALSGGLDENDPQRAYVQAALDACDALATVTTFRVVQRRSLGASWKDIVVERVRYERRRGPLRMTAWEVVADHLLHDDEIADIAHPRERDRASARHKVAKRRSDRSPVRRK